MNDKIRRHLARYAKVHGWPTTDDSLIEIALECGTQVHRREWDTHRWWVEYLYVRDIDGMLIGHRGAETSGDMSADERGYEFDPGTICEMRAVEVAVTKYEPING